MADLDHDSQETIPHNGRETTNDPEKTLAPEQPTDSDDSTMNFDEILRDFVESRHGVDTEPRQLGVVFEGLNIIGVGATASYQETMGSRINPLRFLSAIQRHRHPQIRNILSNFEGVVRPGEMLLVLGAPGSGCSTFLKLLANRYEEYHQVTGDVHYDGDTPASRIAAESDKLSLFSTATGPNILQTISDSPIPSTPALPST